MLCVALYSRPYIVYHLSYLRQGLSASRLVQLLKPLWVVTIPRESYLLQVHILTICVILCLQNNYNCV